MRPQLYKVRGPWSGQLAIVPRPRGGDWLEDEIESWKKAGVDAVVSLLTVEEAEELDLSREAAFCRSHGLEFLNLAIPDRGLPSSRKAFLELAKKLEGMLREGTNVVLHCRAGIGRSAMLAATVLILGGVDPQSAFEQIQTARGCPVPDTREQREWVVGLAAQLTKAPG